MMKKLQLLTLFLIICTRLFSVDYLSESSDYIDVYFEQLDEGGYIFYADNRHFIPQFVSLGFTKLTNLSITTSNPTQVVLQPGDKKVELLRLETVNKNQSYSFRSRLTYANGDPYNTNPDNFLYMFPFEHGKKYKLDQGFGGKFSHQGENYYALDFSMDIGTPVYAARDGVVIEVKEDSNRGGPSSSYADDANYVAVYHSDGTTASYVHLKKNGAEVEVGDEVKQGDLIGYSGNTGLSTGPHLHFSVNIPSLEGVRQSIPIQMLGIDGEAVDPVVGEYYYSMHPGKEYFEVVYGKDITADDYTDYKVEIEQTDNLKFRDETIDDTTIIYCQNGYKYPVDGTVKFQLQNSILDRKNPIQVKIPPLSEVFITIVKPKRADKSFAFSYSISYRVLE